MTDPADAADLLALAEEIAVEAAATAVRLRRVGVQVAATKSSPIDIVTEADRAVERLVRDRLIATRPDDALLGEEGGDHAGTTGVRWIVDPIDGTVNYLYGLGGYAVSIGVEVDGVVVAGVVVDAVPGTRYTALRGRGAFRDGVRLQCRGPVVLEEALVATGFNYEHAVRARQATAVARLLPRVRDLRRRGSCALDLCAVAAGEIDAYVEEGPELWDDAAGGLIAQEAGARLTVGTGASGKRLVICAPDHTFSAFESLVEDCAF